MAGGTLHVLRIERPATKVNDSVHHVWDHVLVHQAILFLAILACVFFMYEYARKKFTCRYCGGEWGNHTEDCVYRGSGTYMR